MSIDGNRGRHSLARYYFNTHDRDGLIRDDEGLELTNLSEAKVQALEGARSFIADGIRTGIAIDHGMRFDVTDDAGNLLHSISLVDALEADGTNSFAPPPQ